MTPIESVKKAVDNIREIIIKPLTEFTQKNANSLQAALYTTLFCIGIETLVNETVSPAIKIGGIIAGAVGLIGDIALIYNYSKKNQ